MGYRDHRLTGAAYDDFIETFVEGVLEVFPRAILQWEDFHKSNAFRLLDRYQKRITSFNDDIQGTAAVVLAAIRSALRITHKSLGDQRIVIAGGGAAGIGIGRLIRAALRAEKVEDAKIAASIAICDQEGLIHEGRHIKDIPKLEFAWSRETMRAHGFDGNIPLSLLETVKQMKPTILIGATAQSGLFTEEIVRAMAEQVDRPIFFALSNPTSKSECVPEKVVRWTRGRAIIATGSPFDPVRYDGVQHVIAQANNALVFPGIGLGCILSETREVSEDLFLAAADALASCVSAHRIGETAILPSIADIREVSARVAAAVIRAARDNRQGRMIADESIHAFVKECIWMPKYHDYSAN